MFQRVGVDWIPTGFGTLVSLLAATVLVSLGVFLPNTPRGIIEVLGVCAAFSMFPVRTDRAGLPPFLVRDPRAGWLRIAKWTTSFAAVIGGVVACLGPRLPQAHLPVWLVFLAPVLMLASDGLVVWLGWRADDLACLREREIPFA